MIFFLSIFKKIKLRLDKSLFNRQFIWIDVSLTDYKLLSISNSDKLTAKYRASHKNTKFTKYFPGCSLCLWDKYFMTARD